MKRFDENRDFYNCEKCPNYDKHGNYCLNGYKLFPKECKDFPYRE